MQLWSDDVHCSVHVTRFEQSDCSEQLWLAWQQLASMHAAQVVFWVATMVAPHPAPASVDPSMPEVPPSGGPPEPPACPGTEHPASPVGVQSPIIGGSGPSEEHASTAVPTTAASANPATKGAFLRRMSRVCAVDPRTSASWLCGQAHVQPLRGPEQLLEVGVERLPGGLGLGGHRPRVRKRLAQ